MMRTEPPPLATWMLEHCTPADRDEALAGDLLEGFRSGRSDAWYWRQALTACAVSWCENLRVRSPLLVFALLWSMLAPAWREFTEGIQNAPIFDKIWPLFGAVWIIPAFALWLALNSTFLGIGIVIFILSQTNFKQVLRSKSLRRSFPMALFIFVPVYAATFVLVNLYWYSYFAHAKLAVTPLGQVADLSILANVTRIPYFIALLCALWNAIPRPFRTPDRVLLDSSPVASSTKSDSRAFISRLDPYTVKRFFALMVIAGLINAMIAAFLLCRLPESNAPTLTSVFARAIAYVAVGALTGVVGAWVYWKSPSSPFRTHPPIPFPLFALVCAAGWVWVPSMMILSEQISPGTAAVAVVGAILLATGLRKATAFVFAPAQTAPFKTQQAELFAASLYRAPREARGFVIAISLYAASYALFNGSILAAAAFFALSAFLFAWTRTFARSADFESHDQYKRAALRLGIVTIPAVVVTMWVLLDGVAHRDRVGELTSALAADNSIQQKNKSQNSIYVSGGYESLILWPFPQKKQIVPPLLTHASFLAPGTTRPMIIHFNGPYWYLQPPDKLPGPTAHQAHGTPLGASIESNNSLPLVMDAHQVLSASIPIARCSEIQVEIENQDNRQGAVAMAVLLTDATAAKKPTLYLGQQPIVSTAPAQFSFKSVPVFETLRFSIPANGQIKTFNEITVMMLPDVEHAFVGPKIAIRQFQIFPR